MNSIQVYYSTLGAVSGILRAEINKTVGTLESDYKKLTNLNEHKRSKRDASIVEPAFDAETLLGDYETYLKRHKEDI